MLCISTPLRCWQRARFLRSFPASQRLPREASASSLTRSSLPLCTLSQGWFPAHESPTRCTTTSLLPSTFCTPSSGQESKQGSKRHAAELQRAMGVQNGCVSFRVSFGASFMVGLLPSSGGGIRLPGAELWTWAAPAPKICWWPLLTCPAPSKICPCPSAAPPRLSSRGSDPVGCVYVCRDEREPKRLLHFSCLLNCSPGRGFRL